MPVVSTAFVGQLLSKEDLAAFALAQTWFNISNETMTGF
jgi:Na+-driven multidrug efflux pump